MKISLKSIYWEFFLLGIQLLGGGYVIVPLMQKNLIEKRNWITQEELTDFYALSQTIPGILAANISTFVGYKLKGKTGAIAAMLGIITVPFFCIVLLASVLGKLMGNPYINGFMWGIGIAVIALIILTVREIWQSSERTNFFYLIFLLSLIALLIFHFSPIKTIIIFSILGVLIKSGGKK